MSDHYDARKMRDPSGREDRQHGIQQENAVVFRGSPFVSTFGVGVCLGLLLLMLTTFSEAATFLQIIDIYVCYALTLILAQLVRNVLRGRRIIVSVDRQGIFDWRISNESIPWSAISKLTEEFGGGFRVQLDPRFAMAFPEKSLSRVGRFMSNRFGFLGIKIVVLGIDGGSRRLAEAFDRFFPQWRSMTTSAAQ